MGDCKTIMADGEMYGTGAEIASEIDLTVSAVEDLGSESERPVIETDDGWKLLASAETLKEIC